MCDEKYKFQENHGDPANPAIQGSQVPQVVQEALEALVESVGQKDSMGLIDQEELV